MNKPALIFLTGFYLVTAANAQAVESSSLASDSSHQATDPGLILVLYDNPMEEHTVISLVIARGYDIKKEKQLNAAIEALKKQAASVGAHAIIVLPPEYNDISKSGINQGGDIKKLSAKAIRYKHFYY